jgi:hypothetical protein
VSLRRCSSPLVVALLSVLVVACAPESRRIPDPNAAAEDSEEEPLEGAEPKPGKETEGTGGKHGNHSSGSGGSGSGGSHAGGSASGGGHSGSDGSGSGAAPSAVDARPLMGSSRSRQTTCSRWKADRQGLDEGTWSGSLRSCDPGQISDAGIESALRMVNLYRWLADLPAVTTTPERNRIAQACALMQHANFPRHGLDHTPPHSWDCYSEAGAAGAITSNLSAGPGVTSVGAYMLDLGNESHLGHRRIVLANFLGPIGLGSTGPGGASCLQAIPGTGDAGKAWLAWPPPGYFPSDAYSYPPYSLDSTGWSIQSEDIDLSAAQVEVTVNGRSRPVRVHELHERSGGTGAIRIVPDDWSVRSGERYVVRVTRIAGSIEYELEIVDC